MKWKGGVAGRRRKGTRRFIHLWRARRQNDSCCKFFFISLVNPDAAVRTRGRPRAIRSDVTEGFGFFFVFLFFFIRRRNKENTSKEPFGGKT